MVYARRRNYRRSGIKSRRRSSRRKTWRRGARATPSTRLGRIRRTYYPRSLFPNKGVFQLTYSTTLTINPGPGAAMEYHNFGLNALYDPDLTGVGHQPRGFDQLMLFYKKATVIGSHAIVTFIGGNTSSPNPYALALVKTTTGQTPPADYADISESGIGKLAYSVLDGLQGSKYTMSTKFSAKKDMSVSAVLSEPNLANDIGSNPSNLCTLNVGVGCVDKVSDLSSLQVVVSIRYTVVCTDRIEGPSS